MDFISKNKGELFIVDSFDTTADEVDLKKYGRLKEYYKMKEKGKEIPRLTCDMYFHE